jgi:hypothetical protein
MRLVVRQRRAPYQGDTSSPRATSTAGVVPTSLPCAASRLGGAAGQPPRGGRRLCGDPIASGRWQTRPPRSMSWAGSREALPADPERRGLAAWAAVRLATLPPGRAARCPTFAHMPGAERRRARGASEKPELYETQQSQPRRRGLQSRGRFAPSGNAAVCVERIVPGWPG